MNPAAILDIVVKADTNGAISGLRRVDRQAAQSSKSFDRLAKSGERSMRRLKVASAAAVAGMVVIGKSSIDMASNIGEMSSKIDVVLGSSGSVLKKFSATAATSFGLSKQQALQASSSFASMFKMLGQSSPAAAQMSVRMTKLAADMASFSDLPIADALQALQSGLRGENEPLRRFDVLLDDATLKQQALADGLIKTTKQALTPQQKAMAAYGVIMRQTAIQQGNFALTSGGLANQQKKLQAQVANMQAELGAKLLPVMLKAVTAAQKFIKQMKDGTGAGGEFRRTLEAIYNRFKPIVKFFLDHPRLIAITVGAWLAYKVAALAALGATRVYLAAMFAKNAVAKLAASAATAGAATGASFGVSFQAAMLRAAPYLAAILAGKFAYDKLKGDDLSAAPGEVTEKGGKYKSPTVSNAERLATGPTTASKIMKYFMGIGLSKQAAAGFVGNFMQESGLRTTAREGGGKGPGLGLAQWSFGRRKQLEAFAKQQGKSANDLSVQLAFAGREVTGDPRLTAALKKAKTPQEAARIIETMYERPKAGPTANSGGRQQWAAQAFAGTISKLNDKRKGATSTLDSLLGGDGGGTGGGTGGKQTAFDRFQIAQQAIGGRQDAGVYNTSQAAQATIDLTGKYLAMPRKSFGVRDRLSIVAARREAQKTLKERAKSRAALQSTAAMKRYARNMEQVDALEAAGRISPTQADGRRISFINAALAGKYGKLTTADKLLVERDRQELRKRKADERTSATDDAAAKAQEKAETARDLMRSYGGTAFTDAALAMAQTDTPGDKSDDLGVFQGRLAAATSFYQQARTSGVEDDIVYWAGQVTENTQAIADLTSATEAQTQQLQEQLATQKELTAAANRRANAAEAQGPAILKTISDMVSGQIGGQVGLGMMTPGYSGGGARY